MTYVDNSTLALAAFRDFFVARNGDELEKAYRSLTLAFPRVVHAADDWENVTFAFNRLFVGPGPVAAPPYASVYLNNEPFVMGETTLKVRRFYEMIGLRSPWNGTVPDDHIALELDACLHMHHGLLENSSEQLKALYSYFLAEHMSRWIPTFVTKVSHEEDVPEPILWVCRRLSHWLVKTCHQHIQPSELGSKQDSKKGEMSYGKMEP